MLIQFKFGHFLVKIEQFWPFEEISIFSNGGHLGYMTVLTDTILKGDHLRIQDGADGHNFERGPPKDHFSKVWLRLAQ